jgi:thymidylate synthase
MKSYHSILKKVLKKGELIQDRTGVGRIELFGERLQFNLEHGFPLVTTKKVHWHSVVTELLWFLRGEDNIKFLHEHGVTIWDEWAKEDGSVGPIYGVQWRNWGNSTQVDQLSKLVEAIKTNPHSSRHIVTAWNPTQLNEMALPPCHMTFQMHVSGDGKLSCQMYQRSADLFLGVPFNIASYALLTHMIAHVTGLKVGTLTLVFGSAHIYANHVEQVELQLSRNEYPLPSVALNPNITSLYDFTHKDIELWGYKSHPRIKAPIAI